MKLRHQRKRIGAKHGHPITISWRVKDEGYDPWTGIKHTVRTHRACMTIYPSRSWKRHK